MLKFPFCRETSGLEGNTNSMNIEDSAANVTFQENGPVDVGQLNNLYRLIGGHEAASFR